jgi:hypothetical protein
MPASADPTPILRGLSPIHGHAIEARFDAALMSSDGGLLMLREIERRMGLARRLAGCIADPRAPDRVQHGLDEIIRFRMLMIAAGYEDGNDADSLRADPLFKLAMDRLPEHADLCSQSTVSRTENLADRHALPRMGRAMAITTARVSARCRAASCSTSTTPSTPCMAASSRACSTPITTTTGFSRSWCSMATAA